MNVDCLTIKDIPEKKFPWCLEKKNIVFAVSFPFKKSKYYWYLFWVYKRVRHLLLLLLLFQLLLSCISKTKSVFQLFVYNNLLVKTCVNNTASKMCIQTAENKTYVCVSQNIVVIQKKIA